MNTKKEEKPKLCETLTIGQNVGLVTVKKLEMRPYRAKSPNAKECRPCVQCLCAGCGSIRPIPVYKLEKGIAHVCGHCSFQGESNSKLGKVYFYMIERCYWLNSKVYSFYGGKGVKVCREWLESFQNFKKWATASGYKEGLTIDRINGNGHYEPKNCRWFTRMEQSQNLKESYYHYLTIDGVTKTLSQWSRDKGITPQLLTSRIKSGWPNDKLFVSAGSWRRNQSKKTA